jgi:glycosyltransferase involved in cell wall biosynthesis
MSDPKVSRQATISVGMPVYNGELYLEEAIKSVLGQSFGDFTLYISDNASTDRTEEICRDYAAQDARIVYRRNRTNVGAAKNYNCLFAMATSPYFRWFNADDISTPDLHEKCLRTLDANPDAVLCCGNTQIIDEHGRITDTYRERLNLQQDRSEDRYLKFCELAGLTNAIYGLMRTSAVAETALMGSGSFAAGDTVFMAELVLYGKFIVIDEPLFFRRMHPQALSWDRQDEDRDRQFWAAESGKYVLPHWKRHFADFSAIWRAPIGVAATLRLWRHVARQMIWSRGKLWRDFTQLARKTAARGTTPAMPCPTTRTSA